MEDQQQPENMMVHLSRADSGMSWGFRLQGGVDFNTPLSIQVVQPKSVAARCGLRPGDGILRINNTNTDGLTHEQAKMEIIRSCNDIDMLIARGAVQIWKPKVTPMSELRPETRQPVITATGDEVYLQQKTSLAKDHSDESSNIGSSYNRSAKPFGGFGGGGAPRQQQAPQQQYGGQQPQAPQQQYGGQQQQAPQQQYGGQPQYGGQQYGSPPQSPKRAVPNVVHAQFNSPIGLYSAGNIANSYAQQTAGIQKQMENLDVGSEPVGTMMTGTYQRLDSDPGSQSYDSQYGNPASPPAASGDDAVTVATSDPASGSPTSLQNNIPSESTECLQPKNGVFSDEHASSAETNTVINPSQPSGFRSVSAPVAKPPSASAPTQESMHCTGCGNLVTGVFVRIKGMPYHEKCFKCVRCGMFLKQKGYFMIDGQLYCEAHARQTAEAPGQDMRCAGAVYR